MHGVLESCSWFALQVGGRREKSVALMLCNRGYETFLPVCRERRRWSDRMQEVEIPLFPGYLFCYFNPNERFPIVSIPSVRVVGVGSQPVPVEPSEIAALRTAVDARVPLKPCPYLRTGQRVLIDRGPLRGLEGIVAREKNQAEVIISVTLLQRSVAVSLDAASVSAAPAGSSLEVSVRESVQYIARKMASART